RATGWWLIYLAIPIVILAWYQWTTAHLYGRGLLLDAAQSTGIRLDMAMFPIAKAYVSLAFTGGCLATVLLFSRQLWSRAGIIGGLLFSIGASWLFFESPKLGSFALPADDTAHLLVAVQLGIWGTAGISLIILAALDLFRNRDADSLLLFMWFIGTFVFA